ncbi:MAG TPA: alanine--tRNA ligase [Bdellovibrionota bacterium]|jgi:alanyl-tRNA synthetase|nr:alanine--tRNA ligase [Bdellovibrionota bacterium]
MKTAEIRESFLKYFQDQGHTRVPSSRVIPANDPTLLFTNSGMVQFKDVFLGLDPRPYTRATSAQKCIRAGGKHNDLENVGFTSRHHTFFEMMGNFSFGDYFKKEAIHYAWEYVTKVLGLPKDKLSVTVHISDDEAADIWHKQEGVPRDRIRRFDEDNFWSMGDTGPCGPCSEIFYDQGREVDGERHLEFWNCVFMQYDRDASGKLTPLAKPSVDTGLGLERTAAILQGVPSNYEIDLLRDLIKTTQALVEDRTKKKITYDPLKLGVEGAALRVIVDHLRSTSFLIADGVLPSNEGRGYVLRRILRRAVRFGKRLGVEEPFLTDLYPALMKEMGAQYPELVQRESVVREVLRQEEGRFYETLDKGLGILETAFGKASSNKVLPADLTFQLYDSFGFPLDLTALIAKERGYQVDEAGFDTHMKKQQERSRASWKGSGARTIPDAVKEWKAAGVQTKFTGYATAKEEKSKILAVAPVEGEASIAWLAISPCPFYAESGGQVADVGELRLGSTVIDVLDAQKAYDGAIALLVRGEIRDFVAGAEIKATVDDVRRAQIRANHTSTHLLHAALRDTLGTHVQQAGSLVNDEKLRFDFSHGKSISSEELKTIEELVNREIQKRTDVKIHDGLSFDDAVAQGAMALFGEKYGDKVRMVDVPGFSKELCGGLHVGNTGEIGLFRINSESGVAAGTRRIEAESGGGALQSLKRESDLLHEIAAQFKVPVSELAARLRKSLDHQKALESEIKTLEKKLLSGAPATATKEFRLGSTTLVVHDLGDLDPKLLRDKGDQLRQADPGKAHVLLSGTNVLVTSALSDFHSGNFVRDLTKAIGGRGGGQDKTAQGVLSVDADKASSALEQWLGSRT